MPENLSAIDLIDFTGSTDPKAQRRVLKKHKIQFVNKADGGVSTTWSAINHALIAQEDTADEPDFNKIR